MKKNFEGKVTIYKAGTNKPIYTLYFVNFDPKKHFVGTDEAKDMYRKERHMSKKKVKEEFDSIYATMVTAGRGKTRHYEFTLSPKKAANTIFIVPKKYRKDAFKTIENSIELPKDIDSFI